MLSQKNFENLQTANGHFSACWTILRQMLINFFAPTSDELYQI